MAEPLTPADCDLRGMPYMPLDVVRLLDSDLFALTTGDEFKAAVALWCKSWNQVPAASLPADDRILARLAGVSLREWATVKEAALRGWLLATDGRLYHPVVAEKACKAWAERERQRDRVNKRWAKARGETAGEPQDVREPGAGNTAADAVEDTAVHTAVDTGAHTRERDREREGIEGVVVLHAHEPARGEATAADWPEGSTRDHVKALFAAAGPGLGDWSKHAGLLTSAAEVGRWRAAGCSWELDVLPTVQALTRNARPDPITTWTYFTRAVLDAAARRKTPLTIPEEPTHDRARPDQRQSAFAGKLADVDAAMRAACGG